MTTLAVDTTHKESLAAQGYAISEWIGFTDHFVPLYAHHTVSDKKVGDVVFSVRVGNPRTLNNGEATYIARKAAQGYFTWKPGDECRKRTFKNLEFRKRPGGGVEKIESAPYMGCAWCRGETTNSPTPAGSVAQTEATPPPSTTATPPPTPALPSFDVLHCAKCSEVFVGDNALNNRRGHMMRNHKKATAPVDSGAPVTG